MLKLFLKASVKRKTVFIDSRILVVASFVFTFVLIFSSSMASALVNIRKFFISPDIVVNESLSESIISELVAENREVLSADMVCSSFGILENRKDFTEITLKKVGSDYFNRQRREILKMKGKPVLSDKEIIISKTTGEALGLKKGDRVAFLDSSNLRGSLYTVAGFFNSGFRELDDGMAFAKLVDDNYGVVFALGRECPELAEKLIGSVSPENISFSHDDGMDITTSLNSIKFILLLFVLLSLCYCAAVIKNYEKRSAEVFSLFSVLGCAQIKKLKTVAVLYITFLAITAGMFAGVLASFAAPYFLTFIGRVSSLDFGYYILSFKIQIPYFKMFIFAAANLAMVFLLSLARLKN